MPVWCFVEFWGPIEIRELVRQVIFFESKGFHEGNVITTDFLRVHGFRNVRVTTCSARPHTKLFLNDLQVVTPTDHNDVISCFICWYEHIFRLEFFKHSFIEFSSRIPCLLDSTVFLRYLTLDLTICFTCSTQS